MPKSPFRVFASQPLNPNKVQIFGPGIEPGVKSNKPTHFTIDCAGAGIGRRRIITQVVLRPLVYWGFSISTKSPFFLLLFYVWSTSVPTYSSLVPSVSSFFSTFCRSRGQFLIYKTNAQPIDLPPKFSDRYEFRS